MNQLGFTLIELLVVFSLGAFLAGIGVVSFAAYSRSQSVSQATTQTKLLVQEARFNALSSIIPAKTPDGTSISCGSGEFLGYKIQVQKDQRQVRSYLLCANQPSAYFIKQVQFPANIDFGNATSCDEIQFDVISAQTTQANCNIIIEGYGAQKNLYIDTSGNITVTSL